MQDKESTAIYEDFDPGDEQVASSECWDDDEIETVHEKVYDDLDSGDEPVASSECYEGEED